MKQSLAIFFILLLSLSALAEVKPRSHYCVPDSTSISCELELALICGPGYIDGCLTNQTTVHKCVLQPSGPSCDVPTQILCVAGLRDGCESGMSDRHQCVPYYGSHCNSDEDFSCPVGFHDSCE